MSTPVRVAAFLTALVAVFAAALGAGRLVGPLDVAPAAHGGTGGHEAAGHGDEHEDEAEPDAAGGLSVSSGGYTVDLYDDRVAAGSRSVSFTITGPDGDPLTDYQLTHEEPLHLIAVRRDFAGYQHVHPSMSAGGTWTADLDLSPGTWRLFADFAPPEGEALTLGADLFVAGTFRAEEPVTEQLTDTVDGYTVTLSGDLAAGESADLTVTVLRDGEAVTDLEPYLGAYGHLVALREGDLAYLHVHPEEAGPGPEVPFVAEVPSEGGYRLFFDFQHGGVVRTGELAVSTGPDPQHDVAPEEGESHDH